MVTPNPKKTGKTIQVIVFQDGLSSRNFEVSLAWIARLGWYLGGAFLVTILAVSVSIYYWRLHHLSLPQKAQLEVVNQPAPAPQPSSMVIRPVTPVKPAVTATKPPLRVSDSIVEWKGNSLKLKFDIRYVGEERKSKQGRIVILARGPQLLISYPSGSVQGSPNAPQIDPERGEYFSVSRYRQTRVEFSKMDALPQVIDIFIYEKSSTTEELKLLLKETLTVPEKDSGGIREKSPE